jgi:hypothetical protein
MLEIQAVLALAPNVDPFLQHNSLGNIRAAVMYQVGTEDTEIMFKVANPKNGAFLRTPSPAWLVENRGAAHFAWTDRNPWQPELIGHYARAFFDTALKSAPSDALTQRMRGVGRLEAK